MAVFSSFGTHAAPPTPEVRGRVYAEEMRLILAHTATGSVVSTLFAVFISAHLLQDSASGVSRWAVIAWLALKTGIALPRAMHAYHCQKVDAAGGMAPFDLTVPLLAIDGAIWGLGGAALMPGATGAFATTVAAIMCCVACVASFGLQVRRLAAMAYVVPMLGPIAVMMLARGDDVGLLGGIGLAIFLGLLLRTSRAWEARMSEVFELRLATEAAAKTAVTARAEAEFNAEQLGVALKLADVHAKSKDRLLAMVSHELRTPLNGILGLVRLQRAKSQPDMESIAHTYQLIQQSGEHLSRLVDDLLDTAAMESGRLALRVEPTKLVDLIGRIQQDYSVRAKEVGLHFAVHLSPRVPAWVMGDSVRIAQIVTNLLTNSMKFTPMGGAVSMMVDFDDDTSRVTFTVEDTGPGISPVDLERIFQPFVQLDNDVGTRPRGVGLGLAICRHLAKQMGGEVICLRTTSQGSAFQFSAKLRMLAPEPVELDAALACHEDPTPHWQAGVTERPVALIVDDDHVSSIVASEVAKKAGCVTEIFENGADMIRRYASGPRTDIIVMDFHMPGPDGGKIAETIRRFERLKSRPRVPIICVSGSASMLADGAPISDHVDRVLAKPCNPTEMAGVIQDLLAKQSPQPALDEAATVPHADEGQQS